MPVVERNNKQNVDFVSDRYRKNRNLDVVRNARKYIWTKIIGREATAREMMASFPFYSLLIHQLAYLSKGVVDCGRRTRKQKALHLSRLFPKQKSKTVIASSGSTA
ncbi:MAG: hypothetical protein RIC55_12375 [Pirellulaceae bacterium]